MRKFTEEAVDQDDVVSLMKAALMSPASKRSNPWQFVLVDNKESLAALSTCKESGATLIAGAALAVIVLADPSISDVWIEDASIATLMLQLQAEDLGLGSCWVQIRERFTTTGVASEQYVRELIDLPMELRVLSIVAIGHKAMDRKPFNEENLQWEKIHLNKYGQQG